MIAKKRIFSSSNDGMWLWLGIAVVIILLDQLSKITITQLFEYGQFYPVTSFFNIVLVHNTGAAFSFLADASGWQRYFFTGIGVAAVIFILYLLRKHAQQRLFCWALSLVLGGAGGNLIDRVRFGYVIDFLDFYMKGWHWPAFNVADSAIFVGAALFILDELRRVKK